MTDEAIALTEEGDRSRCKSCGDDYDVYKCKDCRNLVIGRCKECHDELEHGIITEQYITPQFGGGRAIREDDGGPWQQNAVRKMEGD